MLTRSLCCFRGVSREAERKLWRAGCLCWDTLGPSSRVLSPRKAADLARQAPELAAALEGRVADFFLGRLPVGCRLRVWPDFAAGTAFLDVETTGLAPTSEATVIGLLSENRLSRFVRGRNLDDFLRSWRDIEVLVTFNGTRFDLPVLARTFGLRIMPPHIDLMHEARAYGYSGGLKAIEKSLGIRRTPSEEGNGEEAARLWQQYATTGDDTSLDRLLQYNARDVHSLAELAREVLTRSFDTYPGSLPLLPRQPNAQSFFEKTRSSPQTTTCRVRIQM